MTARVATLRRFSICTVCTVLSTDRCLPTTERDTEYDDDLAGEMAIEELSRRTRSAGPVLDGVAELPLRARLHSHRAEAHVS